MFVTYHLKQLYQLKIINKRIEKNLASTNSIRIKQTKNVFESSDSFESLIFLLIVLFCIKKRTNLYLNSTLHCDEYHLRF